MTDSYAQEPAAQHVEIQDRRHNFTIIDNEIIDLIPTIGRTAFTIYCVLARFANRHRQAWPSLEHIARLAKVKVRTVQITAHGLEELGLLKIEQRREKGRFTRNCYTLLEPDRKRFPSVAVKTGDGGDSNRSAVEYQQNQYGNDFTESPSTVSNRSAETAVGSESTTNKTYSLGFKQDLLKSTQKRAREEEQKILSQLQQDYEGGNDVLQCPSCQEEWIAGSQPQHVPGCDLTADSAVDILSYTQGPDGELRLLRPEDGRPSNLYVDNLTHVEGEGDARRLVQPDQDGLATGEDMDTTQPVAPAPSMSPDAVPSQEVCRYYQPGFLCHHVTDAVLCAARVFWPTQEVDSTPLLAEFRSKEALHDLAHRFARSEITQAAQHWTASGEKLRLPLFFSQLASTLANAQTPQTPGAEPAWARYARKLEERGE